MEILKNRLYLFHRFFLRKKLYSFAGKSILRLIVIVGILATILILAQSYINDFETIVLTFLTKWDPTFVLSIFLLSETILGLIPPDFFIIWSDTTSNPYLMLILLSALSYAGGMIAYLLGDRLASFPRIEKWLKLKFSSHFATMHKYGGIMIVFSALLPMPFSIITLVSGMIKIPFKKVAILGITRFLRFALYAIVLFKVF